MPCEKYMHGQDFPHEPLFMSEERFEKAITEVKKMAWLIYQFRLKKHQSYANKGKMVKINAYYRVFYEPMTVEIKVLNLDAKTFSQLNHLINKIEGYKPKHPEKCYLKVLRKKLEKCKNKDLPNLTHNPFSFG